MNQSVKAVLIFILIMAAVFGAVFIYRYGLPRAQVVPNDSSAATSTTTSSSSSSASTGSSSNNTVSAVASTAISYIDKIVDSVRYVITWIVSSVKASDVSATIIKGTALTAVFFILGYFVMTVAKFIRFILYGLGLITAIVTVLAVLGLL